MVEVGGLFILCRPLNPDTARYRTRRIFSLFQLIKSANQQIMAIKRDEKGHGLSEAVSRCLMALQFRYRQGCFYF